MDNEVKLIVKLEDNEASVVPSGTFIKGEKGDTGSQGAQGEQGIQGEAGPQGEKGDKGEVGPQGEKGDKGDTGKSAYQEWLDLGNTGTAQDFLESIKGEKGEKGDTGSQGAQGEQGIQGEAGPQGEKGDKGDTGDDGFSPSVSVSQSGSSINISITDKNGTTVTTIDTATKLITGQELATNEYIDDKQVFMQRIEFTMPSSLNTWTVIKNLPEGSNLVETKLWFKSGTEQYPVPFANGTEHACLYFKTSTKTLNAMVDYDFAKGKTGFGLIKYTKE